MLQEQAALTPKNVDAIVFLSRNLVPLFHMKPFRQQQVSGCAAGGSSSHQCKRGESRQWSDGLPSLLSFQESWEM